MYQLKSILQTCFWNKKIKLNLFEGIEKRYLDVYEINQ